MAQSRQPNLKCCFVYPWCFFLCLLLLAFIAFISVLFWTSWRPMKPSYTIDDLSIPALNILLHQKKNPNISFRIEVLNPNRAFSIGFTYINLTLCYGDHIIGKTPIVEIPQLKPTEIHPFNENITAYQSFWQNVTDLESDGKVEVKVRLDTQFSYRLVSFYHTNAGEVMYGRVPVGMDGKIVEDKKINLNPGSCSSIRKVQSFIWILLPLLILF